MSINAVVFLLVTLVLAGCQSLAELAYDGRAVSETQRCEKLDSYPERQTCLARVREAERQAAQVRRGAP